MLTYTILKCKARLSSKFNKEIMLIKSSKNWR